MPVITNSRRSGDLVVSELVDSVETTETTYTFSDGSLRSTLEISNTGNTPLIVSVGIKTNVTIDAFKIQKFTESFTAFKIKSQSGQASFRARASYNDSDMAGTTSRIKSLVTTSFKSLPTVMGTPPTITLGASGGASVIANSVFVDALLVDNFTINPMFTYLGKAIRADWTGTVYNNNFPDRDYVRCGHTSPFNFNWTFAVEWMHEGSELEIKEKGITSNKYNLLVDEGDGYKYVFSTGQTGAPTGGGVYLRHVNLGSRKLRRIRYEFNIGMFGGIYVGPNDTVYPIPEKNDVTIEFFGDSNVEGTNASWPHLSMGAYTAQRLGLKPIISGSGGTGYVNPGTKVKFGDRLDNDVISVNPDIVVVAGGNNDDNGTYTQAQIAAEVTSFYTRLKSGLPNSKIICVSNFAKQNPPLQNQLDVNNTIRDTVLSLGIPVIDSINGITYDSKGKALTQALGNWFTGAGNVSATQTTGNASIFVSSDGTHCSPDGHRYVGERLALEIQRILSN